jgi:hypothetical protein
MEPEKKFKNLNARYNKYLEGVSKILNTYDEKKEYSFQEINVIYETLSKINQENLIVEKDIDHLFKNYEKSNQTLSKLESIVKKRNKIIIKNLLSSELYKIFLNKLAQEYKTDKNKIEIIILELIKKYSMVWKCCWSFIEVDSNGTIKKIQLFDINDIQFIKDRININK